jgi:hypothetical protein
LTFARFKLDFVEMIADAEQTSSVAKPKRHKINETDVKQMADLIAKRITETGACLMLGINPQTWFKWKIRARHAAKFENVLTHARETKLKACIEAIDESGDSKEINLPNGKTYTKNGDWRAKAWLAERVLAPERLGDAQNQVTNQTVNIFGMASQDIAKLASKVFAKQLVNSANPELAQIASKPEPKQIEVTTDKAQ